jgi:hypothetical protein
VSGGVHENFCKATNQKAADTAHVSNLTLHLRRRANTSMFISLETRHLAWGSNNIIFIFYFLVGLGLRFFFSRNNLKKVDPHFADRFGQSGRQA